MPIYSHIRRHKLEYLDDGKFQPFFFLGTVGGCKKKKITSSHAVVRLDEKFKNSTNFNIRANVEVKYNKLLNFLFKVNDF